MDSTPGNSPYRQAQRQFASDPDGFWEYLEEHKYDDPTLAIGWAIERAKRFFNLDQVQIAELTAVKDKDGTIIGEPISKSFISAMLYGRSKVSPENYARLAEATQVNPLHFYIAEGWINIGDTAAFELPDRESSLSVVRKLMAIPPDQRPHARAVVLAVLDSIYAAQTAAEDAVQTAAEDAAEDGKQPKKTKKPRAAA